MSLSLSGLLFVALAQWKQLNPSTGAWEAARAAAKARHAGALLGYKATESSRTAPLIAAKSYSRLYRWLLQHSNRLHLKHRQWQTATCISFPPQHRSGLSTDSTKLTGTQNLYCTHQSFLFAFPYKLKASLLASLPSSSRRDLLQSLRIQANKFT